MASFFVELWESIFTPGPTPTMLKATNAAFAALQVVLLSLLAATYSVHFVILSVLCAGLWWSINWFASELAAVQARQQEEEEEERLKVKRRRKNKEKTPVAAGGIAGSDDSDTEVESRGVKRGAGGSKVKRVVVAAAAAAATATTADAEPVEQRGELKQRGEAPSAPGTQSSASTEDEWEKVSENGKDKDT